MTNTSADAARFPVQVWIALQRRRRNAMREHRGARRVRAVISRIEQASKHNEETHHLDVRSANGSGPNHPWLAGANHREPGR